MSNGRGKLGDVVELSRLPWRVTLGAGVESVYQWLVIRENLKVSALQEMTEMLDCQVDRQQFPVKGTVTRLGGA